MNDVLLLMRRAEHTHASQHQRTAGEGEKEGEEGEGEEGGGELLGGGPERLAPVQARQRLRGGRRELQAPRVQPLPVLRDAGLNTPASFGGTIACRSPQNPRQNLTSDLLHTGSCAGNTSFRSLDPDPRPVLHFLAADGLEGAWEGHAWERHSCWVVVQLLDVVAVDLLDLRAVGADPRHPVRERVTPGHCGGGSRGGR